MIDCSLILGSSFKESFGLVIPVAFSFLFSVAKYVLGSSQFLSSKRFPNILPVPGHGVSSLTGIEGRDMLFLGFGGASGKGGCTVVGLRVAGLNFFLGNTVLPNIGISVWEWRPELVTGCWNCNWSHLTFHLQKGLHFLYDSGMWMKPHAPMCTFDQLGHPVPSEICIPCMDVIFTSMSTTSTGSLHLKKPCRKLHSGWSKHTMFCQK